MTSRPQNIILLLLLAGLVLLPISGSRYLEDLAVQIMIYGLFAVSLNVLVGHVGSTSFGHAAFFAIGGYACAYFQTKAGLPLPVSMIGAALVTALCALVIGFFCIRLSDIYFGMLTLAFSMLVWAAATRWVAVTGGGDGFVGVPIPDFLMDPLVFFWFTLCITAASVALLWMLSRSTMGGAFIAVRENKLRAGFLGINVARTRLIAFVIGGTFAGVAGSLLSLYIRGMFPESAFWTQSGQILIMVLLGGMRSFIGPIVGAALLYFLQVTLSQHTDYWQFVLGMILLAVVLFAPDGIVGIFRLVMARFTQGKGQTSLAPAEAKKAPTSSPAPHRHVDQEHKNHA